MEAQLVSFETAKSAKQKGFNIKCSILYSNNGFDCCAPSQSLLQKWLREEYNIHIISRITFNNKKQIFKTKILKIAEVGIYFSNTKILKDYFDTYEEALEAWLIEALKLI